MYHSYELDLGNAKLTFQAIDKLEREVSIDISIVADFMMIQMKEIWFYRQNIAKFIESLHAYLDNHYAFSSIDNKEFSLEIDKINERQINIKINFIKYGLSKKSQNLNILIITVMDYQKIEDFLIYLKIFSI